MESKSGEKCVTPRSKKMPQGELRTRKKPKLILNHVSGELGLIGGAVEEVNSRMSRNEKLLRAFLEAVGTTDFHRLEEICSGDFVLELPYNDPPTHLEGFAAYRAAVEPSLEIFRFRLDLGKIHEGRDPDLLFAEYTSDGIAVPTGKPYRNTYIGVFRFREGRLVSLREFFNPAIAAEALAAD